MLIARARRELLLAHIIGGGVMAERNEGLVGLAAYWTRRDRRRRVVRGICRRRIMTAIPTLGLTSISIVPLLHPFRPFVLVFLLIFSFHFQCHAFIEN